MAKELQRISVTKFESALDKELIVTETLAGTEDVTIEIKKYLSLHEMTEFVQEVVESCIDGETGEYVPEAYDFAFRVAVLTHYANFAMPDNIEKQYLLVYGTRAYNQVAANADPVQLSDIIRAIDKKISFMLDVISSSAVSKITEVINKFGEIAATSEAAFSGIDVNDMTSVIAGMSKMKGLSEEQIANIILNARHTEPVNNDTVVVNKEK